MAKLIAVLGDESGPATPREELESGIVSAGLMVPAKLLPWRVRTHHDDHPEILDANGRTVSPTFATEREAHAAVHAVNELPALCAQLVAAQTELAKLAVAQAEIKQLRTSVEQLAERVRSALNDRVTP
mgnify:CR=1 FL=1